MPSSLADALQKLGGPEFLSQLVGALKASVNDSMVGAEDEASPVDNFGLDNASFQDQI